MLTLGSARIGLGNFFSKQNDNCNENLISFVCKPRSNFSLAIFSWVNIEDKKTLVTCY